MAEKIKLNPRDISDAMDALPDWSCDGERITRTFTFPDFMSAIAFIQRLAPHAEAMDHHPELFNVYNRVRVELTTHDAEGLTDADFALASVINALA